MEINLFPTAATQIRVGVTIGSDHAAEVPVRNQLQAQVATTDVGAQVGITRDVVSVDLQVGPAQQLRLAAAVDGAIGGIASHGEHPTRGEATNTRLVARVGGAAGVEYTNALTRAHVRVRADALVGEDFGVGMPYVGARVSGSILTPPSVPTIGTLPAWTDDSSVGLFVQADSCPHLTEARVTGGVALQF